MTPRRDWGVEAVVAAIADRGGALEGVLVSIPELAATTGLSHSAVQRAISRCVDAHMLAVEPRGANRVNRYRLVNGTRSAPVPKLLLDDVRRTSGGRVTLGSRDARVASRDGRVTLSGPKTYGLSTGENEAATTTTLEGWLSETEASFFGSPPSTASPARRRAKAREQAPARERKRDPLFDAIATAWLGAGVAPGKSAGTLIGMAAGEIRRDYAGEPDQVAARWAALLDRGYNEPTPAALAKHWPTLDRAPVGRKSRAAAGVEAALARAREAGR